MTWRAVRVRGNADRSRVVWKDMKAAILAIMLLLCSCQSRTVVRPSTGYGSTLGPPSPIVPALSARLDLPATSMRAGSTMVGTVVVENRTGHDLHVTGCLSLFAVALTNDRVRGGVAWPTCLERFTLPSGSSSYAVDVVARYSSCQGSDCTPRTPPLRTGRYRAVLFRSSSVLPSAAPVAVVVTP